MEKIPDTYTISVSASPAEGGTVTGGGTYEENSSVTVQATANSSYRFAGWTENGTQVSTDADYSFPATANRTLTAVFEKLSVPVITPSDGGTGNAVADHLIISPKENQTIQAAAGEKVTLTVNAAPDATGFQWFIDRNDGKGFVTLQGATGASYTTSALSAGNNGYRYYCAVSNGSAGQLSPFFTLKVGNAAALPSTGDSSLPMLWAAAAMLAAVGMAFTMKRGKRV